MEYVFEPTDARGFTLTVIQQPGRTPGTLFGELRFRDESGISITLNLGTETLGQLIHAVNRAHDELVHKLDLGKLKTPADFHSVDIPPQHSLFAISSSTRKEFGPGEFFWTGKPCPYHHGQE